MREAVIPLLEVRGLSKSFGGAKALDSVSFCVEKGTVHAVCGENGAGKSTLMKALAGVHTPDMGQVLLNGHEAALRSPADSQRAGIAIVFQELSQFADLSVSENLFANRETRTGPFVNRRAMDAAAKIALDRVGTAISPRRRLGELTLAERQLVEIARALHQNAQLVILDEPNSALGAKETERLLEIVSGIRSEGVTFLYVSHRMEEVFSIADGVTVLRDGKHVATKPIASYPLSEVVRDMIGREGEALVAQTEETPLGRLALEVRGLTVGRQLGPVDLDLHEGEIVGVAGLEGSGVAELFDGLFGLARASGSARLGDQKVTLSSPAEAIKRGIGYVPPSRRDQGLMMEWSIKANTSLVVLNNLRTALGTVSGKAVTRAAQQAAERLRIVCRSVGDPIGSLSGGNQQKALLAKWLAIQPRILLLNDPTRGVDVGAKAEIYQIIRGLASQGVAVLLSSSEVEELEGLCSRVMVLHRGKAAVTLSGNQVNKQAIVSAALGA